MTDSAMEIDIARQLNAEKDCEIERFSHLLEVRKMLECVVILNIVPPLFFGTYIWCPHRA